MRLLRIAAPALVVTALLVSGCSGDDDVLAPEDALEQAKTTLDETEGVELVIESGGLPDGVTGLIEAKGTLTRAPAFDGEITVPAQGLEATVDVVAVDGEVNALLPFTTQFQKVDPSEFGVPDPATLLDPKTGVSSLLPETTDVEQGESVRSTDHQHGVVTEYSGMVPAKAVSRIISTASGNFDVTYSINDEGIMYEAELTGHFYGDDNDATTYTIIVDEYDVEKEITAP